jgi:hypothetical protein
MAAPIINSVENLSHFPGALDSNGPPQHDSVDHSKNHVQVSLDTISPRGSQPNLNSEENPEIRSNRGIEQQSGDLESQCHEHEGHGIHRRVPLSMVALFHVGIVTAILHHVFYLQKRGEIVGSSTSQQFNILFVSESPCGGPLC